MFHAVTLETTVEEALSRQSRFTATHPLVTGFTGMGLSLREIEQVIRKAAKVTRSDDIAYLLNCIDTTRIRQRDGAR